jgi:RsiW-degrading membrane proteinase PrsW (M82 family)
VLASFALLPVLSFLVLLRTLDSYKLIPWKRIATSLGIGLSVAAVAYLGNRLLYAQLGIDRSLYTRYAAPLIEELLKLVPIAFLISRARVGFLVDAAIHGFAIGAGFAFLENILYLVSLPDAGPWLWIVRGFGTAILHGSTTAAAAVLTKELSDQHDRSVALAALPGLVLAVIVHSLYNHLLLPDVLNAAIVLFASPLFLLAVFSYSERATRAWLGSGFDTEAQLLEMVMSSELPQSPVGRYLHSLRHAMAGPVLGDILCLLRIQLELSIRGKGILLAREAGLELDVGEDTRAKLEELRFLEGSVGAAGRMALHPVLRMDRRELWQNYNLEGGS